MLLKIHTHENEFGFFLFYGSIGERKERANDAGILKYIPKVLKSAIVLSVLLSNACQILFRFDFIKSIKTIKVNTQLLKLHRFLLLAEESSAKQIDIAIKLTTAVRFISALFSIKIPFKSHRTHPLTCPIVMSLAQKSNYRIEKILISVLVMFGWRLMTKNPLTD